MFFGDLHIRLAQSGDHALAKLWRRSVEATHHFLPPGEVERLFCDVHNVYLPGVEEVWLAEFAHGGQAAAPSQTFITPASGMQTPSSQPSGVTLAGFIGCNRAHVEMLFVEPCCFRLGVGKALLEHVRGAYPRLTLDVNEQNPQALAFYERQGFRVVGRSALDGQGNPYPLLHMEWQDETL